MRRFVSVVVFAILAVSIVGGFVLRGRSRPMDIRVHARDLPEEGLVIIKPSDRPFEAKLARHLQGENRLAVDLFRPYSVVIENRTNQTVVAYLVQWCFTKADGTNQCYRKAYSSPGALMDGQSAPEPDEARTGKIRPNSDLLLSIISLDGGGPLRVPTNRNEAEQVGKGAVLDKNERLRRFSSALGEYTDVTVSIDGAFFDDGVFVGDNTSGFFEQMQALVAAKRDLLNEVSAKSNSSETSNSEVFKALQGVADEQVAPPNSKSSPEDYYNFYRNFYARELASSKETLGDKRALALALEKIRKPWRELYKKPR